MIREYTDHPTELLQTKTEPLRNKELPNISCNYEGETFVSIYKIMYLESTSVIGS